MKLRQRAAVALALVCAAPVQAATLVTYKQFFQTTTAKVFTYTPTASGSTLTVSSAPGKAIALAFTKAPFVPGDEFTGTFALSASSSNEVVFNGSAFEQTGFSGTYSFVSGALNVLTISFSGGVLTRTVGPAPTVSLLAECPCGITYTSDVFDLPAGSKDYAFSLNALRGANWSPAAAMPGAGYFGEPFVANGTGTFAAVPEPATWVTLIAGFGLVGVAARRRVGSPVRAFA
ncbi:MAG: PEPxxWA-CTERM sorting domain-containing protein [Sphingomonadaceae bacterium]|uniref:PEPxxWA-CTERM sorting domain-containing protein n=1 Tax=Thermaurantiacus sp. TaxID=2820283 RepID=UPI00298F2422|nr:PEPxxWA-CTERM sorting domain-containing protein [Thermaurantiacus sp.]MCS6986087.1 PEPxxWA-CTERM sorting domain-containing protein [Sphingomonadaceae bacterium]